MVFDRNAMWTFLPTFDVARRAQLEAVTSFEKVIGKINDEIDNVLVKVDPGRAPGLVNCQRLIVTFDVKPDSFDAFFNSPVGYRAQFLVSPCFGQIANCMILGRLLPSLLDTMTYSSGLSRHRVELSLTALSAKIWICEEEFPFSEVTEDLAVSPWVAAAKAGHEKARWGLCAPIGSKLEIKGAFLDPADNEVVPKDKIGRRYEIAKYGFS